MKVFTKNLIKRSARRKAEDPLHYFLPVKSLQLVALPKISAFTITKCYPFLVAQPTMRVCALNAFLLSATPGRKQTFLIPMELVDLFRLSRALHTAVLLRSVIIQYITPAPFLLHLKLKIAANGTVRRWRKSDNYE